MGRQILNKLIKFFSVILFVSATATLVTGCGDDAPNSKDSIKSLKEYYAASPTNTGWELIRITADGSQKLVVDMLVTSESDLNKIASVSRMQQFAIAKLGCPITSADLKSKIGKNTEVWVRLNSSKEILTLSICPD